MMFNMLLYIYYISGLFVKVVIIVWYFQCAAYSTISILSSRKNNRLPRLFRLVSTSVKHTPLDARSLSSLRRIVIFFQTMVVFFYISNVGLLCYLLFSGDISMVPFTTVLYAPIGEHVAFKLLLIPIHLICAGAWLLPLGLYYLLSSISEFQLQWVTRTLLSRVEQRQKIQDYMASIRKCHVEFTTIVDCLDEIYNGFIALSYATNIPLGCFVMYMLMWPENGNVLYVVLFSGFILFMDVFYVVIISAKAAGVSTEVRRLGERVHLGDTVKWAEWGYLLSVISSS